MSFFDFSEADLDLMPVMFDDNEVVEFVCIDFNEITKTNTLALNCRVLTGKYKGRPHTIFIDSRDNPFSKKIKVQFALAFWTREEILAKDNHPSKLINRKFRAVAQPKREHEGKTYQSITQFTDLGEFTGVEDAPVHLNGAAENHAASPRY